jgi:F-type H+-transporting ATPase subunit a
MNFIHVLEHHIPDQPLLTLFTLGGITVSLTKHMVIMWIAATLLVISLPLMARSWPLVAAGPRGALEVFVVFMRDDIVIPCLGLEGRSFTPYFLTLFFFILFNNLMGFFPGSATPTGNVSITAGLAICAFFLIIISGIRKHGGWHYLKSFMPEGVPLWLAPMIFPLEVLAVFTRAFALCIRLFANMMAGHIVILAFLCLSFLLQFLWVSVITVPMAVMLSVLELFICFLQAYIFTLLTAVFVGASLNPH